MSAYANVFFPAIHNKTRNIQGWPTPELFVAFGSSIPGYLDAIRGEGQNEPLAGEGGEYILPETANFASTKGEGASEDILGENYENVNQE